MTPDVIETRRRTPDVPENSAQDPGMSYKKASEDKRKITTKRMKKTKQTSLTNTKKIIKRKKEEMKSTPR